jgi:hypothetical protein
MVMWQQVLAVAVDDAVVACCEVAGVCACVCVRACVLSHWAAGCKHA